MKKHIFSLFICFLSAACLGFLSACGDGDDSNGAFSLTYTSSTPEGTFEVLVDPSSPSPCRISKSYEVGASDGEDVTEINGTFMEDMISDLMQKIEESGFMKLKQSEPAETPSSDGKVRILHVRMNGKERSVTVSGDDAPEPFLRAEAAVREFVTPLDQ